MQSKERAKQPQPFAAGYIDPWCHIFTFLAIDDRFKCNRLCCHLKAILDTSAAWREVVVISPDWGVRTNALIRLAKRVTIQFSSIAYDPGCTDVRLWHELGAQKILSSRVRELDLKSFYDRCYCGDHAWSGDLTEKFAACANTLTSLALPVCLFLKNLAAMRTLASVQKLIIRECYSGTRACEDQSSPFVVL